MNSHSVAISIAGCVEEMVCDPNLWPFFFFSFFFIMCFVLTTTGNKEYVQR